MAATQQPINCNLLVIGSGAAGLTAAVTAAHRGRKVLVVEKAPVYGGTTAFSEGMIWVPLSEAAVRYGIADEPAKAFRYLERLVGNQLDRPRAHAYLEHAPAMLAFLEANSHVRYELVPTSLDYFTDVDGAQMGGRALRPGLFDGRRLGSELKRLRRPLASTTIFGGMSIAGADLQHLYKLKTSAASVRHVAGMTARYAADRLKGYGRGTRLGNGNALVAALMRTLMDQGVQVWTETPALRLVVRDGAVTGAVVRHEGAETKIAAKSVLIAAGGFANSDSLKRRFYPQVAAGKSHYRLAPEDNTGDGLALAEAAGAVLNTDLAEPCAWTPVSLVPQPDGSRVPYPHYLDRGKPGAISVNRRGRRFTNEAETYHRFVPAMIATCRSDPEVEAWIVAHHPAVKKYGLGRVPPAPGRMGPFLKSGYLTRAASLGELAAKIGVDAAGLEQTVAAFNEAARRGEDPEFGRGRTAYNRAAGDATHTPNPTLGALDTGPFYAIRMVPSDISTFIGLRTDARSRVLRADGSVVAGLYAAGNDAATPFGGTYPGAGITIGAAMTFGWVVGMDV